MIFFSVTVVQHFDKILNFISSLRFSRVTTTNTICASFENHVTTTKENYHLKESKLIFKQLVLVCLVHDPKIPANNSMCKLLAIEIAISFAERKEIVVSMKCSWCI